MTGGKMRIALAISWLLTAASIVLAVHLRTQNGDQAERILRLEAASNLRAIGNSVRVYQEQSFDMPPNFDPDGQP
ncbi:MAG: hypothetical protein GY842_21040 [bacterium]|nr:hypothetical protein [bacterium]